MIDQFSLLPGLLVGTLLIFQLQQHQNWYLCSHHCPQQCVHHPENRTSPFFTQALPEAFQCTQKLAYTLYHACKASTWSYPSQLFNFISSHLPPLTLLLLELLKKNSCPNPFALAVSSAINILLTQHSVFSFFSRFYSDRSSGGSVLKILPSPHSLSPCCFFFFIFHLSSI